MNPADLPGPTPDEDEDEFLLDGTEAGRHGWPSGTLDEDSDIPPASS